MTELRKQLQLARNVHRQSRYTGDLATDVLGPAPSPRHFWWQIGVGVAAVAAVAALVTFVVWLGSGRVELPQLVHDEVVPSDSLFAITTFPALAVPARPAEMDFSVEAPSFVFSLPEFPSIDHFEPEMDLNDKESS